MRKGRESHADSEQLAPYNPAFLSLFLLCVICVICGSSFI